MTGRYALVELSGAIVNVVVWDGSTVWPVGPSAVFVPEGAPAEPGGSYLPDAVEGDRWVRAPRFEGVDDGS